MIMSTTIPITALDPESAPPAEKSIRAVVSLYWPYSSSTKQCALLLADPDFRLRSRRGQVRVRFTGASAKAVAEGRVGIGDEVILDLAGAQWASEASGVSTPGKSVEGELVYRGQLALVLAKAGRNADASQQIRVNESTPPPEDRPVEQTPVTRTKSTIGRSTYGNIDLVPIYSSPAFIQRQRLSGERFVKGAVYDPLADIERELHDEQPRKRQRISDVSSWRYADRSPSPEKQISEKPPAELIREAAQNDEHVLKQPQARLPMPPPPLPKLQLPEDPFASSGKQSGPAEEGPLTPKLLPVPSYNLPLPSPFPIEAVQVPFSSQGRIAETAETAPSNAAIETTIPEEADDVEDDQSSDDSIRLEINPSIVALARQSQQLTEGRPVVTETGPQDLSFSPRRTAPSPARQPTRARQVAARRGLSGARRRRDDDDEDLTQPTGIYATSISPSHPGYHTNQPEYISDTEEDEQMEELYAREIQRNASINLTREGIRRHDWATNRPQTQSMFNQTNQTNRNSERPQQSRLQPQPNPHLGTSLRQHEAPDQGQAAVEANCKDVQPRALPVDDTHKATENLVNVAQRRIKTPRTGESINTKASPPKLSSRPEGSKVSSVDTAAQREIVTSDQRSQQLGSSQRAPVRQKSPPPPKHIQRLFGFGGDGANDTPVSRMSTSTPQSDRDRVMKRTYSSLFGFKASPSPEKGKSEKVPQQTLQAENTVASKKPREASFGFTATPQEKTSGNVSHHIAVDVSSPTTIKNNAAEGGTDAVLVNPNVPRLGDTAKDADSSDQRPEQTQDSLHAYPNVEAEWSQDNLTDSNSRSIHSDPLEPEPGAVDVANDAQEADDNVANKVSEVPPDNTAGRSVGKDKIVTLPPATVPAASNVVVIDLDSSDEDSDEEPDEEVGDSRGEAKTSDDQVAREDIVPANRDLAISTPLAISSEAAPFPEADSANKSVLDEVTSVDVPMFDVAQPNQQDLAIPSTGPENNFPDQLEAENFAIPATLAIQPPSQEAAPPSTGNFADMFRYFSSFASTTSEGQSPSVISDDQNPLSASNDLLDDQQRPGLDVGQSSQQHSQSRDHLSQIGQSSVSFVSDTSIPLPSSVAHENRSETERLHETNKDSGSSAAFTPDLSPNGVTFELPSPEESQEQLSSRLSTSQHRLDSQPFETQLAPPVRGPTLLPTPEVTNESLKLAEREVDSQEAKSKKSVRSGKSITKAPVRRSPRKVQTASLPEASQETEDPASSKSTRRNRVSTPDRRLSITSSIDSNLLSPEKRVSVRRSTRKLQAKLETNDKTVEAVRAPAELQNTQTRRSTRKSHAKIEAEEMKRERSQDVDVVTPSTKRVASKKTSGLDIAGGNPVEGSEPSSTRDRRATRSSFGARLGPVPDVISAWFSPRRSTGQQGEDNMQAHILRRSTSTSSGFRTASGYYTPLSGLDKKLNPASQSGVENTTDVIAVVTSETKLPERAKGGPRDYFTALRITDTSLDNNESNLVEVFRPWHATLPVAQPGDVVLLRGFAVKSRKRQPYLLSTDQSGWLVWRYSSESDGNAAVKASPRRPLTGAREEVNGPPVELGDEERKRAKELRAWWQGLSGRDEA